ncbi:MAG: PAS domain S-box protein [Gammaproteobacteria bacterium]
MDGKTGNGQSEQAAAGLETAEAMRLPLNESVEKLFNLSLDMLCVAEFSGYFRIVNSAFENTLGYSRQLLLGTPFMEFVHPDDKAATLAVVEQLENGHSVRFFENRYRCLDGSYKWLEWTSVPVIEEGFMYAVARDITAQKAMQQELAAQRDLFDNVLSNVPASIFWKDRNSVYLGANTRFAREVGFQSPEDLVGKTDYELAWTREQADFYRECDRMVMDRGEPMLHIEESLQQADGREIQILTNKVPLRDAAGQVTGMLGIYMDITKRKQAETTLRKSEARLQTLFDSAAEFIFVIDPQGGIINANRYVYEQSGYVADEVIGKNIKDFFSEESRKICDCNFPRLRERGHNRADIEFVCKEGRVIQMECSATAVPDEQGNFTTFLIIQRDVTERKRAAAELANSERRFRAIFNSAYQFIGLLDSGGTLLQINQSGLDFGGLKQEDVVGRPLWDTCWWRYSSEVQDRLKAAIREAVQGTPVRYEEEVLGKDNRIRTIDFTLKPVINQQGDVVLIISEGRDVSDKKQAEEERVRHRQEIAHVIRLSTVGEMASGIAHELNQPLAALVSYCGTAATLAKSISAPPQLCDALERASVQAHRAGRIIRHLREFVGKENDHRQPLDLDRVIEDLSVLLGSELRSANVGLEHHPGCQGRRVMANKVHIEQVLVNLVMNSIEAVQGAQADGGKIILQTRLLPDKAVEVTVTDDGPGIDAGMIDRMFDPFQTSKTAGMGMGLSISRSIIEAHGGNIWADRQHRRGAQFGFSLSVCE